jgi:hypothetical protein
MYKPHTVEQYKIVKYLKEDQHFVMDHFILSPLSRSVLLLENRTGTQLAFYYSHGSVTEIPIPAPPDPNEVLAFIRKFRADPARPQLRSLEEITKWWHTAPNPLPYQQALSLPDDLYRHFLTYPLYSEETVRQIAAKKYITEDEYLGIRLWYRNENSPHCWLGPLGLDGTGNFYGLTFRYRLPDAEEIVFYVMDDYFRFMNRGKILHCPEA